jgi:thiamine phosphate synthase YjbQ (UPF0047 family)
MALLPVELSLAIIPRERCEIIDVTRLIREQAGDLLSRYRKAVYCSFHTTAGYLEQGLCRRLGGHGKDVDRLIRAIQRIFPHEAGYLHDQMQLRDELSAHEKATEPTNADSHLTFIGAGLRNCVTYLNRPGQSVHFIELDGVFQERRRVRRTTVVACNGEAVVHRERLAVPVASSRIIDSFNLKDARFGLFEQLDDRLAQLGIAKGRVEIRLAPDERHVGLTVNEYETLLMRNDLPEALSDPLRYMMRRGRQLLQHPLSIPGKTRDYATYDLIHLYNELMDVVPLGRTVIDRILSVLSTPASRILRLKRHVSLLVSDSEGGSHGRVVQGTYQSPILVQHHAARDGVRYLDIAIRSFT